MGGGTGYLLSVELKGTVTETHTTEITEDGASITFENLPEGSRIYAEASVYENGSPDSILYSGKSETITISSGENQLALALKKIIFIGSKAPGKAKAVGDIVFSDGSATAYTSDLTLTDEQKAAAVAVIFYAGSASDTLGAKTLGVGLKKSSAKYTWAPSNTTGYKTDFTDLKIAISGKSATTDADSAEFQTSGAAATWNFDTSTDVDGSDDWEVICRMDTNASTAPATNYPSFNWCNTYGTTYSLSDYAEGWYMPTLAEFSMMYRGISNLDAAILCAGGDKLLDTSLADAEEQYWTANQFPEWDGGCAYIFSFKDGRAYFYGGKNMERYVRAIRKF